MKKKLCSQIHRYVWPIGFVLSLLCALIPTVFMKDVFYMVHDDYLMNYIANGSYGYTYSGYLNFTNYLYSQLLKGLYHLTENINWYALLLMITLVAAFAILHVSVMKLSSRIRWVYLAVSVILNLVTVHYCFTFTVVAFIAAAAGLILMHHAFRTRDVRIRILAPGVLMVLWATLIRGESVIPALGVMSPLFLLDLLQVVSAKAKRVFWAAFAAFCVIGISYVGFRKIDNHVYFSDEWRSFREYSTLRANVVDYPRSSYDANRQAFESAGIPMTIYNSAYNWSFTDKDVFTDELLIRIYNVMQQSYTRSYRIHYVLDELKKPQNTSVLLIILAALFLTLPFTDRKGVLLSLMIVGMTGAVIFALGYMRLRIVLRVIYPLAVICLYSLMQLTVKRKSAMGGHLAAFTALIGTMGLLYVVSCYIEPFKRPTYMDRNAKFHQQLEFLRDEIRNDKETLYLFDASVLADVYYRGVPIFDVKTTDDFSNVMRSGSWDSFSPRYYDQLKNFPKVDKDNLMTDLLDSNAMKWVTRSSDVMKDYLQVVTGKPVEKTVDRYEVMKNYFGICSYKTKE